MTRWIKSVICVSYGHTDVRTSVCFITGWKSQMNIHYAIELPSDAKYELLALGFVR